MRPGKDIIGKPVITIDEGRFLGNIKDLYLDSDLNLVTGLFLGKEGIIKRKEKLVKRDQVVIFGLDAVLVKNESALTDNRETEEAAAWTRLDDLKGREIDTPGGTRVGLVGDVLLDTRARVLGVGLSRTFVEGPIDRKKSILRSAITSVGDDEARMVVDLGLAEAVADEAEAESVADLKEEESGKE